MVLIQDEGTSTTASTTPPILMAGTLVGMTAFNAEIHNTFLEERILVPSAGSITVAMREPIRSEDSPALAEATEEASAAEVFMAEVVEDSTEEAAATAAGATDSSSHEVIKHETRNDKNDKPD
jgi:hypothetical protein